MAKKKKVEQYGKLHASKTMWLRQHVGDAKSDDGFKYEMAVNVAGLHPIVHSGQSGRWFTLNWQDIINLAVAAGIDKPDPEVDKSGAIVNPKVDKKESKDAKQG